MAHAKKLQDIAKVHSKLHKEVTHLLKQKVELEQRKLTLETLYAKTHAALTIESARIETELSELFVVREALAAKAASFTPTTPGSRARNRKK